MAKVQRRLYGPVDDPLLGGFMDAFCDKVHVAVCSVAGLGSMFLLLYFHVISIVPFPGSTLQPLKNVCVCGGGGRGVRLFRMGLNILGECMHSYSKALRRCLTMP